MDSNISISSSLQPARKKSAIFSAKIFFAAIMTRIENTNAHLLCQLRFMILEIASNIEVAAFCRCRFYEVAAGTAAPTDGIDGRGQIPYALKVFSSISKHSAALCTTSLKVVSKSVFPFRQNPLSLSKGLTLEKL